MYCPNCGTYADSNFCPNCGKDLRNIVIKKAAPAASNQINNSYSSYMQYYPDKLEAIRRLRIDTGMGLAEANRTIDALFGNKDIATKETIQNKGLKLTINKDVAKQTTKKAAQTVGIATAAGLFAGLKVILGVAKKYK